MKTGDQIGPFTIEKLIGSGAMGAVYRGVYNKTGRKVAIKVILPGMSQNQHTVDRFKREVAILKQLTHPNIVRLLYDDEKDGLIYYAMEYVQGESLDRTLGRRGRFSWEEVVTLGQQVCSALKHAHEKGVIHRDLKPGNLMVLPDDTVKLTDFGIAKDLDVTQLTEANCTVGTASYMSPEQCRGERDLTYKSDLYSLGVVLYELLTGKKPFVAESVMDMFMLHVKGKFERPSRLVVDIPRGLDTLICQLMEKKPEQRPLDAATVGKALAEELEKVEARQSAGVEAARNQTADIEDRAAARSLLGEKKKKKKKEQVKVPWHQKTWPKAVGLLMALAAVLVAGWLALQPASAESIYQRIEKRMKSKDPEELKKILAPKGPVNEYLKYYGKRDDEQTRQVKAWRDQVEVLMVDEELTTAVESARKIDIKKMDDLHRTAHKAVRAGQMEEEGDLSAAERLWKEVLVEFPDESTANYKSLLAKRTDVIAQKHLNVISEVHDLRANLAKRLFARMEDFPDDELAIADENERKAFAAMRFEEVGDQVEARQRWRELRDELQKKTLLQTWYLLAASKFHDLDLLLKRTEDKQSRQEIVKAYLEKAKQLQTQSKLNKARVVCRNIIELYSADKEFADIVAEATKLRENIK
jgi:serine/threonine-protein kinase